MIISIVPIKLKLRLPESEDDEVELSHILTLGLVYKENDFLMSINNAKILTDTFILNLVFMMIVLLATLGFATFISIKMSNFIFRPLRRLNMKMRNIITDGMKRDLQTEESSSREIGDLY